MRWYPVLCTVLFVLGCSGSPRGDLIIQNTNIIDVENGRVLQGQSVSIRGRKIVSIESEVMHPSSEDIKIIDGSGKYLIPGFWDMHSHTWNAEYTRKVVFPLEIAHGVVGIRNMAGDCYGDRLDCVNCARYEQIQEMRRDIREGALIGPEIHNASTFLDGRHTIKKESIIITTPKQGRKAVIKHKKENFDLLKVYDYLTPDVFSAIAEEAKKQQIPFAGHVPWTITVEEASEAGLKSIEHGFGLIIAVSGKEETFTGERIQALQRDQFTRQDRFELQSDQMRRIINRDQRAFTFVDSLFRDLTRTLQENNTWLVPTFAMNFRGHRYSEIADHDMMKYLPPTKREQWNRALENFSNAPDNLKLFSRLHGTTLQRMINKMHNASVGILAGTDCDVDLIVPGFHLHQELQFMVEAGLTPLEALQTATLNAAQYFKKASEMGTIEEGKRADMVLLEANPLENIMNTQRIRAVLSGGRLYNRSDLDRLLKEVEDINYQTRK